MDRKAAASAHAGSPDPGWTRILADGTCLLIRPLGRTDAEADRALIESLSARTMHNRFLGRIVHPTDALMERLTSPDGVHDIALAAVALDGGAERFIGVSRYSTDEAGERCECAVVVADAWQGRGVGTALMEQLIALARARGLVVMESTDLAANVEMRQLARDLGFECRRDPDDAEQVIYSLRLDR